MFSMRTATALSGKDGKNQREIFQYLCQFGRVEGGDEEHGGELVLTGGGEDDGAGGL